MRTITASDPVTPAGNPFQLARPSARVEGRTVTLTWTRTDSNGSRITGYTVTNNQGLRKTVSPGTRKLVLKHLKLGLYKFRVTAANQVGTAPPSPAARVRIK